MFFFLSETTFITKSKTSVNVNEIHFQWTCTWWLPKHCTTSAGLR